jgi:FixJ family two-component response regulator
MDWEEPKTPPLICIVEDDEAVRTALIRLVESMGLRVESYASPAELLSCDRTEEVGCLLLDIQLPGMDGFTLHERVVGAGHGSPVIFITAHASKSSRNKARAVDAVAFLEKPFDDQALFDAIQAALLRHADERHGPTTR